MKLCELLNYRATAEELNMTQPGVTQHIQFLEHEYSIKLFNYNGKKLSKTKDCLQLENYAKSAVYNDKKIRESLGANTKQSIQFGATKTISQYVIQTKIKQLVARDDIDVSFITENTNALLASLQKAQLDIAMVEGFFNKEEFDFTLMRKEAFVGICAKNHPFAGQDVSIEDLFGEKLFYREVGSGTRSILEQLLLQHNYSLKTFKNSACISDFSLIEHLVENNTGISFVYEVIANQNAHISSFTIKDIAIKHEFNFVYLKNTQAKNLLHFLH
ncbi:MAG: LysR substrate-binding domain-containing protein [Treponemataceae bacterium]